MVFLLLDAMTIHWPEFWCEPSSIDRLKFIWWNVCWPLVSYRTLAAFSLSRSLAPVFAVALTYQLNINKHIHSSIQIVTIYLFSSWHRTLEMVWPFSDLTSPTLSHLFGELKARNHQIKTRTGKKTHSHTHNKNNNNVHKLLCPIPWSIANALVRWYTHRWTRAHSPSLRSHRLLAPIMFFSSLCAQSLPLIWANTVRRRIHWIGYIETIKIEGSQIHALFLWLTHNWILWLRNEMVVVTFFIRRFFALDLWTLYLWLQNRLKNDVLIER